MWRTGNEKGMRHQGGKADLPIVLGLKQRVVKKRGIFFSLNVR